MVKNKLDTLLLKIFNDFVSIKYDDYIRSKEVFDTVFSEVKNKMAEKCNYFSKYGSQDLYAGSVFDKVKVSKMDEFDMDIVIRLPINYDRDIVIENAHAGFVKLKINKGFDRLHKQQYWENCHKITYDWIDEDKYFLQNEFRQWIQSIVQRALTDLNEQVKVNGVTYVVKFKESGPAYTLNIVSNDEGYEDFKLDVDLVPVIRFMYPRWPEGYRTVRQSVVKDWLVVPKPDNLITDNNLKNRCWRLSFQHFERDMMKGCQHLKTVLRLVKKLRDTLGMNAIASYYIKTLFLWKIVEVEVKKFWEKRPSFLFGIMVKDLYVAIKYKEIKYFWNEQNNLLGKLSGELQGEYLIKLRNYVQSVKRNDVASIVAGLLKPNEFQIFETSELYQRQLDHYRNSAVASMSHESDDSLEEEKRSETEEDEDENYETHRFSKRKFLMSTVFLLMNLVNPPSSIATYEGRIHLRGDINCSNRFLPDAGINNGDGMIRVRQENTEISFRSVERPSSSRDEIISLPSRQRTESYSDSDDF